MQKASCVLKSERKRARNRVKRHGKKKEGATSSARAQPTSATGYKPGWRAGLEGKRTCQPWPAGGCALMPRLLSLWMPGALKGAGSREIAGPPSSQSKHKRE